MRLAQLAGTRTLVLSLRIWDWHDAPQIWAKLGDETAGILMHLADHRPHLLSPPSAQFLQDSARIVRVPSTATASTQFASPQT